jgi:hypothetical protein
MEGFAESTNLSIKETFGELLSIVKVVSDYQLVVYFE